MTPNTGRRHRVAEVRQSGTYGGRPVDPFVIDLTGDLDAARATGQIEEPVMRALEEGHRHLVLDFYYVRFIDSITLRVLLVVRREVLDRGGRLVLANVAPEVLRVFRVTRLVGYFEGIEEE